MTLSRRLAWCLLAAAVSASAQDQPVSQDAAADRQLQEAEELMAQAVPEFEGPQQSRSILRFDRVIDSLEGLRRQGSLAGRGRTLLAQAYELRGRAYYNIGLQEKAAESFRSLVQIQPQHALSKDQVSAKVVDYFNSVKKGLVGYLAVASKPPGARVSLNGEFLSLTDFFPLEVLAGDYAVEIARDGYMTETRSVKITPRQTVPLQVSLTRTAASLFFVTEPAGVEVWIDGQLKTTTAGTLAPDLAEGARGRGLDPARASNRTEVPNLTLGVHTVELRRKCYDSVTSTVEITEARDYEAEPTRLPEALATLTLTSDPPGARISIDGDPMGITPRTIEGVCAGRRRVEVKHPAGKFIQDVALAKNEALSLDCPIRPSLAFLGVVAEGPSGERVLNEARERLLENLARIGSLNFIAAPREPVERVLDAERLTRRQLVPDSGTAPDVLRRVTDRLAAALEVQGFLIAVLPEERLQRTARLHLLAAGNAVADSWDVTFAEGVSYVRFLSAVDQQATLFRPWTGLITVDTRLHEGTPVLRVVPASPAAKAGVSPGEIVVAADGKPVRRTADLRAAVEGKKAKDRLSLQLAGTSGTRALELSLAETPQEIPLNDSALLYNKVMMDLRQQVEGYPGSEAAALARLNLALCAMHFGDFAAAHEHLLKAKTELPARPGISHGTALYYLGVAMERLGYPKEAAEFYGAAAGFKEATLFNNDGPAVASLAGRRAAP